MEALATKYRPSTLEEIVGQNSVSAIIQKQIAEHKIRNCYLFAGPSGTGKTTTARAFARAINGSLAGVIEIDAASNNGVENVRSIVASASERAIGAEYKVYIIDECFTGDTMVTTLDGDKPIKSITTDDSVLTLCGYKRVERVFSKDIPTARLVDVSLTNGAVITVTSDHLFLTSDGWVQAKDLVKGDALVDSQNMSCLWEGISDKEQKLLNGMWASSPMATETQKVFTQTVRASLRCLWEDMGVELGERTTNMFEGLLLDTTFKADTGVLCFRTWDRTQEIIIRNSKEVFTTHPRTGCSSISAYEESQSYEQSRNHTEDAICEGTEWDASCLERASWREWSVHDTSIDLTELFRKCLGIGVPCAYTYQSEGQPEQLSVVLQTRPCLTRENAWDRGGWQRAQLEASTVKRCQEAGFADLVRVDSVEVHERRDNDQLGTGSGNYTTVYDLTVADCPNYFVGGVCVHNCHILSNVAWQAWLKCLEEPPTYTIFMFCTTNPEKIPATILNRLQRYNLQRIPWDKIRDRLMYICSQEQFVNYQSACEYIAKISKGQMRDAIANLDKCASYSTDLNLDNVLYCLGNYSYDSFFALTDALVDDNEPAVLQTVNDFYFDGKDLHLFISTYFDFIADVCKYLIFKSFDLISIPESMQSKLDFTVGFEGADKFFKYYMNSLLALKNEIKDDPNPKTTIEVLLLQMARYTPEV